MRASHSVDGRSSSQPAATAEPAVEEPEEDDGFEDIDATAQQAQTHSQPESCHNQPAPKWKEGSSVVATVRQYAFAAALPRPPRSAPQAPPPPLETVDDEGEEEGAASHSSPALGFDPRGERAAAEGFEVSAEAEAPRDSRTPPSPGPEPCARALRLNPAPEPCA